MFTVVWDVVVCVAILVAMVKLHITFPQSMKGFLFYIQVCTFIQCVNVECYLVICVVVYHLLCHVSVLALVPGLPLTCAF